MQTKEVKRVRFTSDDDLALLREVLNINPVENVEKWLNVQTSMENICGKKFSVRTLKDHLQLLLDTFLKKDKINNIRSGVEEIYSERDQLLQEIADICKEGKVGLKKRKGPTKEENITLIGKQNREQYATHHYMEAETLLEIPVQLTQMNTAKVLSENQQYNFQKVTSNVIPQIEMPEEIYNVSEEPGTSDVMRPVGRIENNIDTQEINGSTAMRTIEKKVEVSNIPETPRASIAMRPVGKKRSNVGLKRNALDYLQVKAEKENILREKEINLEEKKLRLEEKRLAIEEKKLILEEKILEFEERKKRTLLCEKQQKTIENLLNKIN